MPDLFPDFSQQGPLVDLVHRPAELAVQVGPGFKQAFGMAAADPVAIDRVRISIQVVHAAFQDPDGFALDFEAQLVGMLIPPFEAGFGADHADLLLVHRARIHRAGPEGTGSAILVAEQDKGIVLQWGPAFDEALAVTHQGFDLELRHDGLGQEQDMGADITEDIRRAGLLRGHPPFGAWIMGLDFSGMKAMRELHDDHPDLAEIAAGDHLPGLVDHWEAAVTVGHADNPVARERQVRQFAGFLGCEAERFFTDHMQVMFEGRFADGKVCGIRCGDGHHLDAVRPAGFCGKHRLVIRVTAVRIESDRRAERLSPLGIDIQRSRNKLEQPVSGGRLAMDGPDLAALSATHHTPAEWTVQMKRFIDHGRFLSWQY